MPNALELQHQYPNQREVVFQHNGQVYVEVPRECAQGTFGEETAGSSSTAQSTAPPSPNMVTTRAGSLVLSSNPGTDHREIPIAPFSETAPLAESLAVYVTLDVKRKSVGSTSKPSSSWTITLDDTKGYATSNPLVYTIDNFVVDVENDQPEDDVLRQLEQQVASAPKSEVGHLYTVMLELFVMAFRQPSTVCREKSGKTILEILASAFYRSACGEQCSGDNAIKWACFHHSLNAEKTEYVHEKGEFCPWAVPSMSANLDERAPTNN